MCKSLRFLAQMTYMDDIDLLAFLDTRMYRDHSYVTNFEKSFPVKTTFFKIVHISVIYIHFSVQSC